MQRFCQVDVGPHTSLIRSYPLSTFQHSVTNCRSYYIYIYITSRIENLRKRLRFRKREPFIRVRSTTSTKMFSMMFAAAFFFAPGFDLRANGEQSSNGVAQETAGAAAEAETDHDDNNVQMVDAITDYQATHWFEEEIEADIRWSLALNSILHSTTSQYQDIVLLDTKYFGKVLVLDGKLQSAERDEFVYHECLIHPALLLHDNPKRVFIMGGGEGSAAREALRHSSVEKVIMCDIDRMVVDFCRANLTANQEAFSNEKLHCIINDAKAGLESTSETFDVIIGDLADPLDGGPCNHLYTKSFYEQVIKNKLNDGGVFVTQAGPAGVLSHKVVFTSIHHTLKQVFNYVIGYTAFVPSFVDTWGWVMASDEPFKLDVEQINKKIRERIAGELQYLDGASIVSSTILNKAVHTSLLNETHIYTEENARYLYGHGVADNSG